jgi:hypothetical protein
MSLNHFPKPSFPKNDFFRKAHARAVHASHDRFQKNARAAHDHLVKSAKVANDRFAQQIRDQNRRQYMAPASGTGAILVLLMIIAAAYFAWRNPSFDANAWLNRQPIHGGASRAINTALYDAKRAEGTMWAEIAELQKAAASDPLLQSALKQLKLQLKQTENAIANTRNANAQNSFTHNP